MDLSEDFVSIGRVAKDTGVSIDTLRVWEKRYGAPRPVRLPSGHRRYPIQEVRRLQLVVQVLRRGIRPNRAVPAPLEQLLLWIGAVDRLPRSVTEARIGRVHAENRRDKALRGWLDAARALDSRAMAAAIREEWDALGPMPFVLERVVPFLEHVGAAFEQGRIEVHEEHFASEQLSDFLGAKWRMRNPGEAPVSLMLATLPGDLHQFGLIMCAMAAVEAGHHVIYIGPHSPTAEIIEAANRHRPAAVCISISVSLDAKSARRYVHELRDGIDETVELVLGGAGAPTGGDGWRTFDSMEAFANWCRALAEKPGG